MQPAVSMHNPHAVVRASPGRGRRHFVGDVGEDKMSKPVFKCITVSQRDDRRKLSTGQESGDV